MPPKAAVSKPVTIAQKPKKSKPTKVSASAKTDKIRKPVVSTSSRAGIKFPPARV